MPIVKETTAFKDERLGVTFNITRNIVKEEKRTISITFDFNERLYYKSSLTELDKAKDEFYDVINGKIWCGVAVDNYFKEDTYSYLITDGTYYKIGKSKNPHTRLSNLKTANPKCKLIAYSKFVPEKFLHDMYRCFNFDREWFLLPYHEVQFIKDLMAIDNLDTVKSLMHLSHRKIKASKPSRSEAIDNYHKNVKLQFGKFAGRKLGTMVTKEEKGYLRWLKDSMLSSKKTNTDLYKAIEYLTK